jgi:uncharacterized metal-binding protein YceD (DUF177 family)
LGGEDPAVGGHLSVTRTGRDIVVRGALSGEATTRCDRCGEARRLSVSGDVDCVYAPVGALARGDDEEPPEDAPEQGEYDGVALDLVHVVREFFALERPARLLCADLDPAADAACLARFRARAHLGPSEPDPRFAALKGVKPTH